MLITDNTTHKRTMRLEVGDHVVAAFFPNGVPKFCVRIDAIEQLQRGEYRLGGYDVYGHTWHVKSLADEVWQLAHTDDCGRIRPTAKL